MPDFESAFRSNTDNYLKSAVFRLLDAKAAGKEVVYIKVPRSDTLGPSVLRRLRHENRELITYVEYTAPGVGRVTIK